jgi:hypothetical protein
MARTNFVKPDTSCHEQATLQQGWVEDFQSNLSYLDRGLTIAFP